MHRIFWQGPMPAAGERVAITGDEAAHTLRVKRLRAGDAVELLDGVGGVASAVIEPAHEAQQARRGGPGLTVRVLSVRHRPPTTPELQVWAATPKGARVDEMVEGLSEVGAASWVPLHAAHSIVEPRATKLDRLSRLAAESAKQCGRAWLLRIEPERSFDQALLPAPGAGIVIADASGPPFRPPSGPIPTTIRLLIGPEGGWTHEELARAQTSGATLARFGPHAMRIETAAVAAAAIVVDQFSPWEG
jgi:16S rRNA (uracil1498-N3)-methyltransferase